MSTRKLSNILKRKFMFRLNGLRIGEDAWVKNQIRDLSRLGGNLIVMKAGS